MTISLPETAGLTPLQLSEVRSLNKTLSEKVEAFYENLRASDLSKLADIYADDIEFIDPVGQHSGLPEVTAYFAKLLDKTAVCTFEIMRVFELEDTIFMAWTMHYASAGKSTENLISVPGLSEMSVRDGRIDRQADYYDLGAMVYENLPLLGQFITLIRRRLSA